MFIEFNDILININFVNIIYYIDNGLKLQIILKMSDGLAVEKDFDFVEACRAEYLDLKRKLLIESK